MLDETPATTPTLALCSSSAGSVAEGTSLAPPPLANDNTPLPPPPPRPECRLPKRDRRIECWLSFKGLPRRVGDGVLTPLLGEKGMEARRSAGSYSSEEETAVEVEEGPADEAKQLGGGGRGGGERLSEPSPPPLFPFLSLFFASASSRVGALWSGMRSWSEEEEVEEHIFYF